MLTFFPAEKSTCNREKEAVLDSLVKRFGHKAPGNDHLYCLTQVGGPRMALKTRIVAEVEESVDVMILVTTFVAPR